MIDSISNNLIIRDYLYRDNWVKFKLIDNINFVSKHNKNGNKFIIEDYIIDQDLDKIANYPDVVMINLGGPILRHNHLIMFKFEELRNEIFSALVDLK